MRLARFATVLALAGLGALPAAALAQTTTADPIRDPRYMSGARDIGPPEVPEALKSADALTRIGGTRRITACADPFAFPSSEMTESAQGYDIDLFREVARHSGWEASFVWVSTESRGGLGRAFRTTIKKGMCDVFLGLATGGRDEVMEKARLALLAPAFGVGYVLVTFDPKLKDRTLETLGASGAKVAATYFSPTDNILTAKGIAHESFPQARRALEAMGQGRVDVAMVPSTALATLKRDFPDRPAYVLGGLDPATVLTWNSTWAVPEKEAKLRAHLERTLAELSTGGQLNTILARYGIPYFPPFAQ